MKKKTKNNKSYKVLPIKLYHVTCITPNLTFLCVVNLDRCVLKWEI